MEELVLNNLTTILQGIYIMTKNMSDNYENVDDNYALLKDLSVEIMEKLDEARNNGGLDLKSTHLKQLYDEIKQAKLFLEYYLNIEQKYISGKRSRIQKAGHAVKKFFYYAPEYDKKFNQCIQALNSLLDEVTKAKKTKIELATPIASGYKDELKEISLELDIFWGKVSGEKPFCNWTIFVSRYKKLYKAKGWTSDDWERLKHAIGAAASDKVDITGLMELAKETNFPIEKEKLPSTLDSEIAMDVASRIEIGKMIKSMIRLFSSEKMDNHMHNVQHWYSKFDEKKEAANELYKAYVEIRKKNKPYEKLSIEEKLVYDVEKARRDFSSFYQEFWVIVKFGSLSRSMIHSINFPGERNINQFIEYFKPLDHAYNSIIVNHKKFGKTNDDGMKLYTFLDDFLNNESVSKELEEMSFIKDRLLVLKKAEEEFEEKKIKLEEEKAEFKNMIDTVEKQKKHLENLEKNINYRQLKMNEDEKKIKDKEKTLERKVKLANLPENVKNKFLKDSTNKNSKNEDESKETRKKSEVNTKPGYYVENMYMDELEVNEEVDLESNDEIGLKSKVGIIENHVSLAPPISVV